MTRQQAHELIKTTFTQSFDKDRFAQFINELLNGYDQSNATLYSGQMVKHAFKEHVNHCHRLGTYTTPEKETIDILTVHLTKDSKLEKARTAIRNYVAYHLDQHGKDAALVAFVSPSEKTWRFSYVKLEYKTVTKNSGKIATDTSLTPARRFSYIVGEGESCHTAQTRFVGLLENTLLKPSIEDIQESFSVETVTKEFFEQYVVIFKVFCSALENAIKSDSNLHDEFSCKNINQIEYVKKLMGQIVFLYFLQRKGWLGVPNGSNWGDGPKDFLRKLANKEYVDYVNFHNDVLQPLFYDTLATDRGHEAWSAILNCRIPFLNGGLFEPMGEFNWKNNPIALPNNIFTNKSYVEEHVYGTGILDVFDRYNFTVSEAEPLEKEVAIDPEMLGKIFENLIEENRRKGLGAFYTPREIVHYMCQASLSNYLFSKVKKNDMNITCEEIDLFVHIGDQASYYEKARISGLSSYGQELPRSIIDNARLIDETLSSIKVCDPAVGSGAFAVGMMSEIVRCRSALTPFFNDVNDRTAYLFKRQVIQNSIYGVDIDAGAVEIAKLRLWLSLVVDEEDVQQIKPLPNLDYKIVNGNSLLRIEREVFNNDLFSKLEVLKPAFFNETNHQEKINLKGQIDLIINELTNGKESFDFEIFFSEVFHGEGGFDIVIANPPYISYGLRGGQKMTTSDKAYLQANYSNSAEYKISMYAIFMELGIRISNANHGVSCFIVPDSFLLGMYFSKIRSYILHETDIRQLVLLPFSVFKAVVGFSVVYMFERNKNNHKLNTLSAIKANSCRNLEMQEIESLSIEQSYYNKQKRSKFRLFFDCKTRLIVDKCISDSLLLDSLVNFRSGLIGVDGKESIISESKITTKWLPGIKSGGDIYKFITGDSNIYILFDKTYIKSGFDCIRYDIPKLMIRQTGDRLICAYDNSGLLCLNNVHVGNARNKNVDLLYICGILNSKLMTYFYQAISLEVGRVMPQIDIEVLADMPIKINPQYQTSISELVSKSINLYRTQEEEKAKEINDEIDRLVYKLYCLSDSDIAFIDTVVK